MATFAERKEHGLHLLARPSIRNWGPIEHFDLSGSPARSLDLVMPSRNGQPLEFETYKHSRLMFKARVVNWDAVHHKKQDKRIEAKWEVSAESKSVRFGAWLGWCAITLQCRSIGSGH